MSESQVDSVAMDPDMDADTRYTLDAVDGVPIPPPPPFPATFGAEFPGTPESPGFTHPDPYTAEAPPPLSEEYPEEEEAAPPSLAPSPSPSPPPFLAPSPSPSPPPFTLPIRGQSSDTTPRPSRQVTMDEESQVSELSVPGSSSSRSPVFPLSSRVARLGRIGALAALDGKDMEPDSPGPANHVNPPPDIVPDSNGNVPHGEEDGASDMGDMGDSNHQPPPFDPSVDTSPGMMAGGGLGATSIELEPNLPEQRQEDKETLFFTNERQKRIDFVLVYKDSEDDDKKTKRSMYESNLEMEGLEIESEDKSQSVDGETYYTKVHAPFNVLLRGCELLGMKKRIKMPKNLEDKIKESTCCQPFEAGSDIIPEEDDYFTMPFSTQRMDMFDISNPDTFFTNAERTLIVKEILDRTSYTVKQDSDIVRFGIRGLLNKNVYIGAFPLHEGQFKVSKEEGDLDSLYAGPDKDRARLYEAWARPGRFLCYQPLDLIRKYFGEKIAIYFAWLGFYTQMLIPAAIFGILAFLYGLITLLMELDVPSNDVCDKSGPGNFTMCPLCDKRCTFWKLEESCLYSKLSYLFDNYATVAYAGFMAIWATLFLEFWKRKQKELEFDWDVSDFELEERMRPEFEFKVQRKKENPITRIQEPYLSWYSRGARTCTSFSVILFMILLVLAAIFAVVIYRIIIVSIFYVVELKYVSDYAKLWTSFTAAGINVVLIMILNIMYRQVAIKLTDIECHRTDTEYEDSFTFKMFLFQFINFYGSIFYIAFFKGRFMAYPGSTRYYVFGKWKQDECDPAGCLIELCIQLAMVMILKQALNNFKEILLPVFKSWFLQRKAKKMEKQVQNEGNLFMRWEQDHTLAPLTNLALFDEYLEMVIQFGFVTIFVAAFPLAPFFALMNNIIEIRLDAYKFVTSYQRPVALKAQDIGAWYGILQGISFIAVLSNSFIIGWTTTFVPKMVYKFELSENTTFHGYVNDSLSVFSVYDFTNVTRPDDFAEETFGKVDFCRYKDYRNPPGMADEYEYTREYWLIFAARLAFVIVFEHVCFLFTWAVTVMVPDIPGNVKRLMLYEKQLTKKMTFDAAFAEVHDQVKQRKSIRQDHNNPNGHYGIQNDPVHVY